MSVFQFQELNSPQEVDTFLREHPTSVIFKAGTCFITDVAINTFREALAASPAWAVGYITVVQHREASNHLAQISGFRHESPQVIIFKNGQAVKAWDNYGIRKRRLVKFLAK